MGPTAARCRPAGRRDCVMTRGRRGGHVGIVTGVDAKGNPIMISGNNGNRVREAPVSRGRIYAYVMPTSSGGSRCIPLPVVDGGR